MRTAFIAALAALAVGCGALDSLIFHPLHVVIKQHEYNEQAKAVEQANSTNAWPTTK